MDCTGKNASRPDRWGWATSLAFWLCLLLATFLFAAAALAPQLLANTRLRGEFYRNQVRLVTLERRVRDLRTLCEALQHDPAFAQELARADFKATRPGDERLAVDPSLSLPRRMAGPTGPAPARVPAPWYVPLLETVSGDSRLRAGLIAAAALITLAAFTFLPASPQRRSAGSPPVIRTALARIASRYRRPRE